jgi:hypothetical protein
MAIDPQVERPTRHILGHAMRGELDKIADILASLTEQQFLRCLGLCISIAGYIAIDVSGRRSTESDIGQIASALAERESAYPLTAAQIQDFLSGVVFGGQDAGAAVSDGEAAVMLPIHVTASLLANYRRIEGTVWDYLDTIETAFETAETVNVRALAPALLLVWHPLQDAQRSARR